MTSPFQAVPAGDIVRFVSENPLAWIVPSADPSAAILMPLLLETDDAGNPASLLGHLPRWPALLERLWQSPSSTCLFLGPNVYVPPGWVSKPGWAPTWNFLSLKASGQIRPDDTLAEPAIRALVTHMEAASGWTTEAVGERFQALLKGVTGFRMQIDSLEPRFKLGQDESDQSHAEIYSQLGGHPLQAWMRPR